MQVTPDANLIVRVPQGMSMGSVHEVVRNKLSWILRKQRFARENYLLPAPKAFVPGEKFLYLGEECELCVIPGAYGPLVFDGKRFFLRQGCAHLGRWLFRDWYREQAAEYFSGRVQHYAGITGVRYSRIGISDAKGRWGSCSSKGVLSFNWRLVMAPREVADYVVAHEVVHLEELNHSKRFWEKVERLTPGFLQAKRWLDLHHRLLQEGVSCA